MNTIHKYELEITESQMISPPSTRRLLKVAEQNGKLNIWFAVDDAMEDEHTLIHIVGTGHEIPDHCVNSHIDSVLMSNGLVWHIFQG
jgi:hypothetical protein